MILRNLHPILTQGLVGLPFGTYPSFIYYRRSMFDAAGLAYPPHTVGELYDGETWNTDKLRELGMLLTLDSNGKNATEVGFDPNSIVQWGFVPQFSEVRGYVTMFGASHPFDTSGTVSLPVPYQVGFPWFYNGMWVDHFIPNANQKLNELGDNPFQSNKVAMANTHLWYTCCVGDVNDWDIAVVPSYDGIYTAKLHDDSFRIMKRGKHYAQAFSVMTYLIGDASLDLLGAYGGMPARTADQPAFLATLDQTFPQDVDWQVVSDSLNYADSPSHEASMPNYQVAKDRFLEFQTLIEDTSGLDIQVELATLMADLQVIASQRLPNGSFEDGAVYWEQKNTTGDKVKCNQVSKVIAYEGDCAFLFKGGIGENSKLSQYIDNLYLVAGKELSLNGMVNAKGAVNASIKVIVTYTDSNLPTGKLTAKLSSPTAGYQPLNGTLSLVLAGDALSIKLQIINKSASGKIYLDALVVQTTLPATNVISLPPLPLP